MRRCDRRDPIFTDDQGRQWFLETPSRNAFRKFIEALPPLGQATQSHRWFSSYGIWCLRSRARNSSWKSRFLWCSSCRAM